MSVDAVAVTVFRSSTRENTRVERIQCVEDDPAIGTLLVAIFGVAGGRADLTVTAAFQKGLTGRR